MKMRRFILFLAVAVLATFMAVPVSAIEYKKPPPLPIQTNPRDLHLVDVGRVEEVLKSDTIRVGKDKKIYKIDNLRIPLQMNMAARDFLEESILGKTVGVYITSTDVNARKNELGHIYAHILTQDGKWVEDWRAYSSPIRPGPRGSNRNEILYGSFSLPLISFRPASLSIDRNLKDMIIYICSGSEPRDLMESACYRDTKS